MITIASFQANEWGTAPLEISFKNLSQSDERVTYLWDFGDGEVSEETNPVHIYESPGQFEVVLSMFQKETGLFLDNIKSAITIEKRESKLSIISKYGPLLLGLAVFMGLTTGGKKNDSSRMEAY